MSKLQKIEYTNANSGKNNLIRDLFNMRFCLHCELVVLKEFGKLKIK